MLIIMLSACESDADRERREWDESFGLLVAQYDAMELDGPVEELELSDRKILADTWASSMTPEPYEARTVDEVGLVVVDHTVSDTEPSAVYDNGMEGFGGTITMAAFAHPEGKRVATITFKCVAPIVAFESDGLQYGNTCSGSKASRLSYGAELTGAVLPIGQNVDTKTTEAMEELAAKYVDRLGQPIAEDAPSLTGRRVLQYSGRQKGEEPATWNAWQHEAHIPAESMARSVDEVGLLILRLTRWEATPSHTYEGGQPGFEGTVEMVAVALPEGVVVGVFRPDCTINTQRQMDLLEGLVDDSKCASDPALTLDYVTRMLQ